MSRLASLSTPSRSRASLSPSPGPSPSPQHTETTHHRMLKIVITEVKNVHRTWDELIGVDGIKAGKGVIDESTTMDNLLQSAEDERPEISSHLMCLYEQRAALETVLTKFQRLLVKLSMLIDQAEKVFFEAYQLQGPAWVTEEPLWLSWSLERFVQSLPPLILLHSNHLTTLTSLAQIILNPETSFDRAKLTLERWRDLSIGGERYDGVNEWQELVDLEMSGGGDDEEIEEEKVAGSGRKKKGRK